MDIVRILHGHYLIRRMLMDIHTGITRIWTRILCGLTGIYEYPTKLLVFESSRELPRTLLAFMKPL